MKKGIFLWGGWILIMLLLMVFTDNYGMQIVLALSIILPTAGIAFGYLGARRIEAVIKGDISQLKEIPINYSLEVKNNGRFSCSKGVAKIKLENMLTGEVETEDIVFSVGQGQDKRFKCKRTFDHCGKIKITLESLQSWDFLGIYSKTIENECKTSALILPKTYPIQISIGNGNQTDLNSDEYSMYRSGFDPSETFAIREYRPGDKIKNIHWKLSEKLEEVTVRELGLPINNTVLLLLNNFYPVGQQKISGSIMDAIGESIVSIAQVLCDEQIPFQIGWYNKESNVMEIRDIMNPDDLSSSMAGVLSAEPTEENRTILESFKSDFGGLEYAHVIVVGAYEETENELLECDSIISNFVCKEKKLTEFSIGNGKITYFTPSTMKDDLFYIEV